MKTGIELIAEERERQIQVEGYTPESDEQYDCEDLASAATCYAAPKHLRSAYGIIHNKWPWDIKYWKPTPDDRVRELVKAGALIAAEIDRLQRGKAEVHKNG